MVVICAGCERPIVERFLLNVLDRAWHTECVQCADCKDILTEKCFEREGKLYCRDDFFRRFATRCGGCSREISPNELVRRARSRVYHLVCFTCLVCRKQLTTGEELYMLDDNRFICKNDYLAKFQGSHEGEDGEGDLDSSALLDGPDDGYSDRDVGSPHDDDDDDDDDMSRDSRSLPPANNDSSKLQSISTSTPVSGSNITTSSSGFESNINSLQSNINNHQDSRVNHRNGVREAPCQISPDNIKQESILHHNTDSNCSLDSFNSDNNLLSSGSLSCNNNNNSNGMSGIGLNNSGIISLKDKENNNSKGDLGSGGGTGIENSSAGKRRGPRTTIKAKQLETLKAAFAATPKPTRHIREQLAQETGLNMRVIQVWFQNRRSKERRMKQLSALGVRRQFYRNPRRLRALRPGEDLGDELGPHGFGYFVDGGEFYPGYGGYGDYFNPHLQGHDGPPMGYLSQTAGPPGIPPHLLDQVGQPLHDGAYLPLDMAATLRQGSPPDGQMSLHHDGPGAFGLGPHHVIPGLHGSFIRYPGPGVSIPSAPVSGPGLGRMGEDAVGLGGLRHPSQPSELAAEIW